MVKSLSNNRCVGPYREISLSFDLVKSWEQNKKEDSNKQEINLSLKGLGLSHVDSFSVTAKLATDLQFIY